MNKQKRNRLLAAFLCLIVFFQVLPVNALEIITVPAQEYDTDVSVTPKEGDEPLVQRAAASGMLRFDPGYADAYTPPSKNIVSGQEIGDLPTTYRIGVTGYTFVGWYIGPTQLTKRYIFTFSGGSQYDHVFTATARWDVKHTVTFNTGTSSVTAPSSILVEGGETYGSLPSVSRTGYTFDGWYTNTSYTTQVTANSTAPNESHTLYAKWTPRTYTVSFNSQNEEIENPDSITVTYDRTYGTLPTLSQVGYTFGGWSRNASGTSKVTATTTVSTASAHTLYAVWTPNKYNVSFDSRGGNAQADMTATFDAAYGSLPIPTRTGYTFTGWYADDRLTEKVTEDTVVHITSDHTLYPDWSVNSYILAFDTQTSEVTTPQGRNVVFDTVYGDLPELTRTGYTFGGWYLDAACSTPVDANTVIKTADNHTLYAAWTPLDYIISFSSQASDVTSPTSITVTYDSAYGTLPDISRTGYTFAGWFTGTDYSTQVTSATILRTATNHTLYAKWIADGYTVSFDSNGGSLVDNIAVVFDQAYGELPLPSKTGYSFMGWFIDATLLNRATEDSIVKTGASHTLYAKWQVNDYTITFDMQCDDAEPPQGQDATYGATYGTLPAPTRTGYTFVGWYLDAACTKAVTASTTVVTPNNHTLYAAWTPLQYTVVFAPQVVGLPEPDSITVTYDSPYGTLPNIDRTGYTLESWYLDGSLTLPVGEDSIVKTAKHHILYAGWTANWYNLSFDVQTDDIAPPDAVEVQYTGTYGNLPIPERTGYTFGGWYFDAACTKAIGADTVVDTPAHHTVYADWSANTYTLAYDTHTEEVEKPESKTVTYDAAYGTLPVLDRTGYTFDGWYLDEMLTQQVTVDTIVKTADNHTLHAKWTADTYNLSFDTLADDVPEPSGITVTYDAVYGTLPVLTRTGYTFGGWHLDDKLSLPITADTLVKTVGNHTLYAKWTANEYTLSFDTLTDEAATPSEIGITYDAPYGALPVSERTGYALDGWYLDEMLTQQVTKDSIVKIAGSHTLYASWLANTYTLTYDTLADNVVTPEGKDVIYDSSYGALPELTRTGYTFGGWYVDDKLSLPITADTLVKTAGNHTLYAKWTANEYTLSFDTLTDEAATPNESGITYDAPYGALPVPERTGYTLDGWYLDEGLTQQVTKDSIVKIADSHTLYARWLANTYTLTYDTLADNVVTPEGKDVIYDSSYGTLPELTRTGYTFGGWYLDEMLTQQVTKDSIVKIAGSHTLYARWLANTYTLTYDTLADNVVTPEGKDVIYDSSYGALPELSRIGYTFGGWYLDDKLSLPITADTLVETAGNHTLYAKWTANEYTLSFDTLTDEAATPSESGITYDAPYGALPVPERTGYTLDGWYLDEMLTQQVTKDSIVKIADSHTLYARWLANTYMLTYDTLADNVVTPEGKDVIYDSSYGALPELTRTGYTFGGWYLDEMLTQQVTKDSIVKIAGSHTLYARWLANTYTLTYDTLADNVVTPEGKDVIYDSSYGTLPELTRTGYTFDGWHLDDKLSLLITADTLVETAGNHTLYAKWTANEYTLSFDTLTDEAATPNESGITYDAPYGALPVPERTGYTWDGWYLDEGLTQQVTKDSIVKIADSHTLYAKWLANTYMLTYDTLADNVATPEDKDVIYDSSYGTLPVPERTGYTFIGWYSDAELTNLVTADDIVKVANDHTLYAAWSGIGYQVSFDTLTGDAETPSPRTATYGDAYGDLPVPERIGYVFAGWYLDIDLMHPITNDTIVNTAEHHTLYAAWQALRYKISYDTLANDVAEPEGKEVTYNAAYGELPQLNRNRYNFEGWYLDAELTDAVDAQTLVNTAYDHTLYAAWARNGSSGGSNGAGGGTGAGTGDNEEGSDANTETIEDPIPLPSEPFAYVNGYTDATFRPDAGITRAEAATMLCRLLSLFSDISSLPYSDVNEDAWYAASIGGLSHYDILTGYPDGTFRPDAGITRAEMITIAARLRPSASGDSAVTLLDDAHWAVDSVNHALRNGWIDAADGLDRYITRAETVMLLNRMLDWHATDAQSNHYADLTPNHPAYIDILLAS